MNSFVITINNTTFNFVVSPGTTIDIKANEKGEVYTNTRSISNISCVSEENTDEQEIIDTIQNITFREKKTKTIEEEDDADFCREFQNITIRNDDTSEFCKPVKHSYEKDAEGNYKCPYCDAKKKKVNTLSEHVRANHSSEYGRNKETFYCDECEKGFPTKTRRDHHVKTFHAISYEKCPHIGCSYDTAKNASTLIQHYVKHHMDYKEMYKMSDGMCICNDCGSASKTGMLYHLGVCNKASPFFKHK